MIHSDPTTHLRNRVGLQQLFSELTTQAITPLYLLLVDIDGLIAFNDHYGCIAGDELLKEVAQIIQTVITPERELFRVYGDEFATLIMDSSPQEVFQLAEQICQQVKSNFQHLKIRRLNKFVDFKHPVFLEGTPTVSCAIALYPQQGKNLDSLFIFADSLLYEDAKPQGGNCVAMARFSQV